MCYGCWESYFGRIEHPSPEVIHAAELVKRVYEFSCVGGNLHCEIDDFNLEDKWFIGRTLERFRDDTSPEQWEVEQACFEALKDLSEEHRASAVALAHEYWSL